MEDVRSYRDAEETPEPRRDEEDRVDFGASKNEEDVPFYIPRD